MPELSQPCTFCFVPERCGVIVEARSTAGRIDFAAATLHGQIQAYVEAGRVALDRPVTARLEVPLSDLVSGNALYDAELQRRLDARRFPHAVAELTMLAPVGDGEYAVGGPVTLHGVTRQLHGSVRVSQPHPAALVVTGEQVVDIRDFELTAPGMLMLRIYPDVRVLLHLEAERVGGSMPPAP